MPRVKSPRPFKGGQEIKSREPITAITDTTTPDSTVIKMRWGKNSIFPQKPAEESSDINHSATIPSVMGAIFKTIHQHPRITAEEEKGLAILAQAGDLSARNMLVTANLWVALFVAKKFFSPSYRSTALEDLYGYGVEGLLAATKKFDSTLGVRFSTYAHDWALRKISYATDDYEHNGIRKPVHTAADMRKIKKMRAHIKAHSGIGASDEEIATLLNMSQDRMSRISAASSSCGDELARLDGPIGDKNSSSLITFIADEGSCSSPEKQAIENDVRKKIMSILKDIALTTKERTVIAYRFGFGGTDALSLGAIGQIMGCTRARIHQIETKALKKIRRYFYGNNLSKHFT